MQIYVSGSVAYDRIMDFPGRFEDHILPDQLHNLNVAFMVNGLTEQFGGTAGNIAYSLSLLGEKPVILASAGSDFERYETWLARCGLTTEGIRHYKDTLTPGAYIITDRTNNQITGFNPGAMQYSSQYSFRQIDPDYDIAIVAPGNLEDMRAYSRFYQEIGLDYIFDPGQAIPALSGDEIVAMLTGCHYLISNGYELKMIKKATGLTDADFFTHCEAVITTLGANGSLLKSAKEETHIGAVPVDVAADPTGAGDAFRAGLIKGLIEKRSLADAARMGAVSASFAVEKAGTQVHTFTPAIFEKRYRQAFSSYASE